MSVTYKMYNLHVVLIVEVERRPNVVYLLNTLLLFACFQFCNNWRVVQDWPFWARSGQLVSKETERLTRCRERPANHARRRSWPSSDQSASETGSDPTHAQTCTQTYMQMDKQTDRKSRRHISTNECPDASRVYFRRVDVNIIASKTRDKFCEVDWMG